MLYLLGSRYCETDRLTETAWATFGGLSGWTLVQAIVTYAHERIGFDYQSARSDKTAWDAHEERVGVCRDYAHLAIALVPLHERAGALLHRLYGRHGPARFGRRHGFLGLVRGLARWALVRHSTRGTIIRARAGS